MFGKNMLEKKDYIAKIAGDVFYSKGFKEASLQDISAKGKLSKAGLYHYFKSKEEMLFYILMKVTVEGIQTIKQTISENDAQQLQPEESFKKLVKTYANYLLNKRKMSLLVLRERHQLSGRNRERLIEKEGEIYKLLRSRLDMIPNLHPGISIQLIVFQIISMLHWMGYWFSEKGELSREQAIDQSIILVFDGITCPGKVQGE